MVWCDVYGVVWYGVMWYGMVWCGMLWCNNRTATVNLPQLPLEEIVIVNCLLQLALLI